MYSIKYIFIHCSASDFGNAALISVWHKQRGWRTIGYHFVVQNGYPTVRNKENSVYWPFLDGQIEVGRALDNDMEMSVDEMGAHVYGWNKESIAICMIGNHFSKKQIYKTVSMTRILQVHFNIKTQKVLGHYEVDDRKTCPNYDMDNFRNQLLS